VVLNFVSKTDPIRVRFSIDERRYLRIARRLRELNDAREDGQRSVGGPGLELILADSTVHPHRGRTVGADAAVDPQTGTFTLEADFPNPEELVLAGQFARIRATVNTIEDAILVPQRSISELQGLFRAYVIGGDGVVELREIELGPKVDQLQVVLGLERGERVALEVMRLRPGQKVAPRLAALDESGAVIEESASEEAGAETPAAEGKTGT
jgi:membrane fusion protein (multidrug efflux system)